MRVILPGERVVLTNRFVPRPPDPLAKEIPGLPFYAVCYRGRGPMVSWTESVAHLGVPHKPRNRPSFDRIRFCLVRGGW